MTLRECLDRVLGGTETVRSLGELALLRRIANLDELQKLDDIEREFRKAELNKQSIASCGVSTEQVLQDPASASLEDLQAVLKRSRDLRLTTGQVDALRATLSRIAAERYRGESKPSELKRLGWLETPVGPIDPVSVRSFDRLRIAALTKIEACTDHAKRNCQCYSDVRDTLCQLHNNFSADMPEGWLASRILHELDAHSKLKVVVNQ